MRCPFCHNSSLIPLPDKSTVSENEVFDYLTARKNVLQGVCISGGEPLLQPDLYDFIKKVRRLGYKVKLDTNGSMPDRLQKLLDGRLIDYVAMDIKNSPAEYGTTAGVDNFDVSLVERSIEILFSSDVQYEFRTTLVKELHSQSGLHAIGEWLNRLYAQIPSAKIPIRYFLQAFEDSKDVPFDGLTAFDSNGMAEAAKILIEHGINARVRGQ